MKDASNTSGKKNKHAGPYGAHIEVSCPKNMNEEKFDEVCAKVDKAIRSSVSYRLGITIRKPGDETNTFKYVNYVQYFGAWIKYRIKLEERLIGYLLDKAAKELHLNEVYLYAVQNREKLLKALPKVLASKTPAAVLAKALKMPEADAEIILERKVRQLAALEESDLKTKIKSIKAEIKGLKDDQREPGARAARDTAERVKNYMKKPDPTVSGLPVE
uniref:DNA gyrase/topoisomerase IV subunit A n=1 Tax=Pseudomonas phage HRDY3 TaxID=3236930 RepID=A0AB39CE17_9VIRU